MKVWSLPPVALHALIAAGIAAGVASAFVLGPLAAVYLLACWAVAYATFCRLVIISRSTWWPIRAAFVVLACSAAHGVFGVLVWQHKPSTYETFPMCAVALLLLVASRRWRNGVPTEFDSQRMNLERGGSL